MASVNKCIFIGNLGRDPEIRYMPSGDAMANFSIACTDSFKDKSGAKQERTEWVRIVMFGKQAEIAGEYLKKGSSVYIEGRIQTREWDGQDGVKRNRTEIVTENMILLDRPPAGGGPMPRAAAAAPAAMPTPAPMPASAPDDEIKIEDIPF